MKWLYSDNPTPRQRANRIIAQRKWREIKKKLKVDGERMVVDLKAFRDQTSFRVKATYLCQNGRHLLSRRNYG